MRAGFHVVFDTNERDIIITLPDFLAWGRWAGRPAQEIAQGDLEDYLRCMWLADTRLGNTVDGFEDWAAGIVDFDRLEVGSPKATGKAASSGRSSNSKR